MHDGKITIKTNVSIFTLSDLFMWLFMFLTFVVTSINSASFLFQLRFVVLLGGGILGLSQLINKQIRNYRIILFILICAFSWFMSFLLLEDRAYEPNLFLYSFLYMGLGVNLVSHKHNEKYSMILFYFACGITLVRLVILNEPIRGFLKDGASYNFISVLLLLFLSYYCIELIQKNKRIPYLAGVLFAWISVLAYGRGGIITGLFFLLLITLLGIRDESNKTKQSLVGFLTIMTIVVGCAVAFAYLKLENYGISRLLFAKFYTRSLTEEPRLDIWRRYINECTKNLPCLLFGADSGLFFSDGNLHNAFFQMHSSLGLIPLIILLFSFGRLILYSFKTKKMYLLCMLLTVVVRSMTDKTAFQGYCEPIIYGFLFTWFNVKEKKRMVSFE